MIRVDELTEIGSFFKPHGIKGEIAAAFDPGIEPDELRCIVLEVDGIFVPFFIESSRGTGKLLVKLEGIDNVEDASAFANRPIYALSSDIPHGDDEDDGVYLYDLIGYNLFDGENYVGKISAIDDSTANVLMHVEAHDGSNVFIPFADEWIENLDTETKKITMNLPEGILNLN